MATKISALLFMFMATIVSGQVVVEPAKAVIVRGGNVSMVCKVAFPIDSCRVRVAGVTHNLNPKRVGPSSNVQYNGNGFESGECGVSINRVEDDMNGNITCYIPSQSTTAEIEGIMQLIIAKAPEQPQLTFSSSSQSSHVFMSGDTLLAKCEVPHGRPPAKLSWYLGNEQLLEGLHQVVILDEPNSELQTVSQNLTKTLKPDDDGVSITCKAEHEALSSPYKAVRQLVVQYAPHGLESNKITIFGVRLREDGLLNLTIRANPQPQVTWTIGSIRLDAGETDHETGRFDARHLQPLGNGYYVATLLIRNVEKADVDRQYLLSAKNERGEELFTVKISTNDEPEALELDAGSIVGIVVAVLVILVAVTLAVYARTTHRWCFAGAPQHTDIPDGDSEAPVAPHHDHDVGIKGSENPTHNGSTELINGHKELEKKPDTAV